MKVKLTLTPEERKAILAGNYTALKREQEPDVMAGDKLVLAWSKGGPQFLERGEEERRKAGDEGKRLVVDIERKPTVWIEIKGKTLKDGKWVLTFKGHDEREQVRTLAPAPSPPREPGLKTRWGTKVSPRGEVRPKRVPKRGEEIGSFTSESERGYGGGGQSVDEVEGVDDEALREFAADNHERFARHRDEIAEEEQAKRQAKTARSELTETLKGFDDPAAAAAFLAEFQRMCQKAKTGRPLDGQAA